MERPHEDVSIGMTCVSFEILEDGPYTGMIKGINSLLMPWMIFPWMAMMRPCTLEKKGPSFTAELIREICDRMLEGLNTCDKGGTC